MKRIRVVYILAKNESRNIDACLASIGECGLRAVVLDSGSTDTTARQVALFPHAEIQPFRYINHCESYNELTQSHAPEEALVVIDADMRVHTQLNREAEQSLEADPAVQVIRAPVRMFWDGQPIRYCSLYPPKPFVFRGGASYFEPVGHGERLRADVRVAQVRAKLDHDDRKSFANVLANQWRYALDVVRRSHAGQTNLKDKLRRWTPLMMLITPLYALIIKRGFLDGRAGVIYALDRLIAETLAFRASISLLVLKELDSENSESNSAPKDVASAPISEPTMTPPITPAPREKPPHDDHRTGL